MTERKAGVPATRSATLGATFNSEARGKTRRDESGEEDGRTLRKSFDDALQKDLRPHRTDPRLLEEDALREEFDEAARSGHRAHDGDDGDEDGRRPRKSWKQRADEKGQRRSRGRGYGMKRGGD